MAHGPEHSLEQAEHGGHTLGPFDRKVAMTMAIVAAGLACVSLLSHRGHTETLRQQSQANAFHTEASDAWNFYQAKNIRSYEFQSFLKMSMLLGKNAGSEPLDERIRNDWVGQVNKYEGSGFWEAYDAYLKGMKTERPERRDQSELTRLEKEARAFQEKAKKAEEDSERVHHAVNWVDFGHLAFELALVLASLAILTKQRGFWLAAIAVAVSGAVLAFLGVYSLYLAPHY